MFEIVRLHHVSFAVKDVSRSREFFGGVLGLREIERPAFDFPGAWYAIGDRQLHLIEERGADQRPGGGRISRSDHMALEVDDVTDVRKALEAAGIDYQTGGNEALGFEQVFCGDPDGHTIEFVRYR
jgi:glyoxylase I family protein